MAHSENELSKGFQTQDLYTVLSEGYQPAIKGYQPNSTGQNVENTTSTGLQNYGTPPQGGSSVSAAPNVTSQKKE